LKETVLKSIYVFDSRSTAFKDDDVLQENIIYNANKGATKPEIVSILNIRSGGRQESHKMKYSELVRPGDSQLFIHITSDENSRNAARLMSQLPFTLSEIDLTVSTGRVVDFRAKIISAPNPNQEQFR